MSAVVLRDGGLADLAAVMTVMDESFEPCFGEAWTAAQCAGLLPMPGVWLTLAQDDTGILGFALSRIVVDEAELLLLAVREKAQRHGVGRTLLDDFMAAAQDRGARRLHLEVREGNHAISLYQETGFAVVGRRMNYYSGVDGDNHNALTLAKYAGDPK